MTIVDKTMPSWADRYESLGWPEWDRTAIDGVWLAADTTVGLQHGEATVRAQQGVMREEGDSDSSSAQPHVSLDIDEGILTADEARLVAAALLRAADVVEEAGR